MSKSKFSATSNPQGVIQGATGVVAGASTETQTSKFLRRGLLFVLIGFLIYVGLYAVSDQLIYQNAKRNRFYVVKTAPLADYDTVILGASHAVVFDYEDMNARLEQMTGSRILNLSIVGGGVTVNRLLLGYFLATHRTKNVLYVLDSFAFYTREWNEDRFQDVRLFDRAPFDPVLFQVMFQNPPSRSVALDYLAGFSKINNPDRFKPDISEDEATRFTKTYRPVSQIDKQRIEYLYPKQVDQGVFQHYLAEFEDMIRYLKQRNIRLIVIKPPIPTRMHRMLPNEEQFDQSLKAVLERKGIEFRDFSAVSNDERFFFNPDHLNRTGVLYFFENYLKQILVSK